LFSRLISEVGSELEILLKIPIENIAKVVSSTSPVPERYGASPSQLREKIAEGVQKVRTGSIVIKPGYDGVYGVVKIWHEGKNESNAASVENSDPLKEEKTQLGLEF